MYLYSVVAPLTNYELGSELRYQMTIPCQQYLYFEFILLTVTYRLDLSVQLWSLTVLTDSTISTDLTPFFDSNDPTVVVW